MIPLVVARMLIIAGWLLVAAFMHKAYIALDVKSDSRSVPKEILIDFLMLLVIVVIIICYLMVALTVFILLQEVYRGGPMPVK